MAKKGTEEKKERVIDAADDVQNDDNEGECECEDENRIGSEGHTKEVRKEPMRMAKEHIAARGEMKRKKQKTNGQHKTVAGFKHNKAEQKDLPSVMSGGQQPVDEARCCPDQDDAKETVLSFEKAIDGGRTLFLPALPPFLRSSLDTLAHFRLR